ncbi:MAG: ABC transporter permease subunit [Pseudomonadota bacterium]
MLKTIERVALWSPAIFLAALSLFLLSEGAADLTAETRLGERSGRLGGVAPILINTLVIVAAALALTTPISLSAALAYLIGESSPKGAAAGRIARRVLEIGLCSPRLFWGLAGAVVFGGVFGLGLSAASGALTLACLLIPIMTTSFIEGVGEAGRPLAPTCRALGYDEATFWIGVVLPTATPTLRTGFLLALSRGLGDAAALMLTAGFGLSLLSGIDASAATLAVYIYKVIEVGGDVAQASACALILLVLSAASQAPLVISAGRGSIR